MKKNVISLTDMDRFNEVKRINETRTLAKACILKLKHSTIIDCPEKRLFFEAISLAIYDACGISEIQNPNSAKWFLIGGNADTFFNLVGLDPVYVREIFYKIFGWRI